MLLDEVTSGLDVSVQAKVLDLIRQLQRELGISMIVVSHDLGVIRMLSDRTIVLKHGRIVETGLTDQILQDPQHAYTQLLVSSLLNRGGRCRIAKILEVEDLHKDLPPHPRRQERSGRSTASASRWRRRDPRAHGQVGLRQVDALIVKCIHRTYLPSAGPIVMHTADQAPWISSRPTSTRCSPSGTRK